MLPADVALSWADQHLRENAWKAHGQALQVWASLMPAYAYGGEPPEPPEPPED